MNEWRPKDWDRIAKDAVHKILLSAEYDKERVYVEAGADAILKEFIEWGDSECPHDAGITPGVPKKWECFICRIEFKQPVEE